MISSQLLRGMVDRLKEISQCDLAVADREGHTVAATRAKMSVNEREIRTFAGTQADIQEMHGCHLIKVYDERRVEYILTAEGGDQSYMVAQMAAFQLEGLMAAYREQLDRDSFIKNLLLDNLLLVDIYSRAQKLHIKSEERRCVLLAEAAGETDAPLPDSLRGFSGLGDEDLVTAVDDRYLIVVRVLHGKESYAELDELASGMQSFLAAADRKLRVAYGSVVGDIREVSRSYKEAKMAMDVGRIFFPEKMIAAYRSLGIGRLIYQLPLSLCRMFIQEIFADRSPDGFDEETLTTIDQFFENSLNVSETSRRLYIHRNTLVYRLDKIQKTTGLDIRVFEDAITFKIALMVVKYMKYMESFDYIGG